MKLLSWYVKSSPIIGGVLSNCNEEEPVLDIPGFPARSLKSIL